MKNSMVLTAGLPVLSAFGKTGSDVLAAPGPLTVPLRWLDKQAPVAGGGVTWGVPWPKGIIKKDEFILEDADGKAIPQQSWPLAWWPDGSLKWSAHAISLQQQPPAQLLLKPGKQKSFTNTIKTENNATSIRIDTGVIQCELAKKGNVLVNYIRHKGRDIATGGKLVLLNSTDPDAAAVTRSTFEGDIEKISLEQNGPLRAVVKIEGKHTGGGRAWLPFIVRLYFYQGSAAIRVMHTIVFDGDEQKDFITGLGLRFTVPLKDELHNRHVRFCGENQGVFAEAVRGLTGLRRDPGEATREAQVNGKATPDAATFPAAVKDRLQYIPAFGDYTLSQITADGFTIQKRTGKGFGWVSSAFGKRAAGLAYLGTPQGGIALGIRNFWQSHPAQLDIRNAATDNGEITAWLWAPDAPAMDLRFYHDGMGQDTFPKQREGLEITYEDYEPGFGTAMGVARTSELQLHILPATPANAELAAIANTIQQPPVLSFSPEHWRRAGVFGSCWSLPPTTSPATERVEKELDFFFNYYHQQVEQRHWYGYWNYGDVMHSYDADRHQWRYDVGGFAWDNSELSTDMWLWYYFLRSGRADVFRMAEAMTRHTGEVDVHHLGRFAPLGSRHNVQHWGCSAKQLRISTATNRRFYYYLTGDERVGDLMREQIDAAKTLRDIVPGRKIGAPQGNPEGDYATVSFGTDWGSLAAAWLTEWERTGNTVAKDRLLNSMQTIAAQPNGFFTGGSQMELATGKFKISNAFSVSHLSAAFGLPEICLELIDVVKNPAFEKAWLQYCTLYNASAEEQQAALGKSLGKLNLRQGHARLTAFAANRKKDPALAARAWKEFINAPGDLRNTTPAVKKLAGPEVLNPIDEAEGVSTNAVAQWGLTAVFMLEYLQAP